MYWVDFSCFYSVSGGNTDDFFPGNRTLSHCKCVNKAVAEFLVESYSFKPACAEYFTSRKLSPVFVTSCEVQLQLFCVILIIDLIFLIVFDY